MTMGLASLPGREIDTVLAKRSAVIVTVWPTTTGFRASGEVTPVTLDVTVPSKHRSRTVLEEVLGEKVTESAETAEGYGRDGEKAPSIHAKQ